ncbi:MULTISPECIES: response regulator transcription factor [unclassified Arcicella]|uniref:response regulator transcription factor n=1 Tax=unclassified Arcicella TaxID=2644986 RepID=UPI0028673693|nr:MULTISPECIES: response regulator transcription factor [unclassified Arcicella]MDR6564102.1 DNA-binding response OmpR family regulator [Arcicella sp. BE51]MDR6813855.1 DNA-binding response OmpR family regulator [Arcicella sp. BE140]MDR6825167.1 DNA-binding response OmpR family regulator [Arcicella sp. BE139]
MTKTSLLLVEDDADLGRLLTAYLQVQGLDVSLANDSEGALGLLKERNFDIVVLDVMLPKGDGFSLANLIKVRYPNLPFLFLTARRQKEDVLKGLSLGADDYMVKPFDADELVLRLQNILRRSNGAVPYDDILIIGGFSFEPSQLRLSYGSTSAMLTKREAGVLELLAKNLGRIVSRKDVLEQLWGNADYFNGRSLDVYIGRLRKILEQDSQLRLESVRGSGFILHVLQ